MSEIDLYISKETKNLIGLLEKASKENDDIEMLYTKKLKPILQAVLDGRIHMPSTELKGYTYYFFPEGPWRIWEKFPDLSRSFLVLSYALCHPDDQHTG